MTSVPVALSASGPLSRQWLAVACSADVRDAPAAVRLLGRDLVVWRSPSGAVVAAPDRCTHSKGDLTKGDVHDGLLACPKHGWTFGDEGRCVFKPSGLPINDKAHLKTHASAERYGLIWVALNDPAAPIPDLDWDSDDSYRTIHSSVSAWRANPITIIESLLAQADSPFDNVVVDMPFVVHGTFKSDDGSQHRRLLSCAPVDSRTALVASVIWTNSDATDDDQKIVTEAAADLDTLKSAAEGRATLTPTIEIGSDEDAGSVDWKRRLLALFGHPAA